jgi:beta-aspartyl-peptidase (threonine type)
MRLAAQAELTVAREVERYKQYQITPPTATAESFTAAHSGGTVGAVAMDVNGNLAAATSTGGTPYSLPGRVGDSPLVGCGTFADNETGAASATGHGERIMEVVLAKHATDLIRNGLNAKQAAVTSIEYMHRRVKGYGGLILIDKDGTVGFSHNTPHMAAAWIDEDGTLQSYIKP